MTRRGRLIAAAAAATLLGGLAGCSSDDDTHRATATTPPGSPVPPGSTGVSAPGVAPAERDWPFRTGPVPSGRPGLLATAVSGPAADGFRVRLWFKGAPAGWSGRRLLVVYPAVDVSSDGTRTVAHLKLPTFWCTGRAGAGSPNFRGCTGRRVEYGDVSGTELRAVRDADGTLVVSGDVDTYRYGAGQDRDPARARTWTGRTWPLRLVVEPVSARSRELAGRATITLGRGGSASSAVPDGGYPNSEVER